MKTTQFTVEKYVREETDDYGRAGEVEWHLKCPEGETLEVYPLKRLAKAHADRCNAALVIR